MSEEIHSDHVVCSSACRQASCPGCHGDGFGSESQRTGDCKVLQSSNGLLPVPSPGCTSVLFLRLTRDAGLVRTGGSCALGEGHTVPEFAASSGRHWY